MNGKHKIFTTAALIALAIIIYRRKRFSSPGNKSSDNAGNQVHKRGPRVNKEFVSQLLSLLKVVIPGLRSKEALLLGMHTTVLVGRTLLSIYLARLDGILVKTIIELDIKGFLFNLFKFLAISLPASYVNSMIKFLESKLAIAFRTRLTDHLYGLYMSSDTFYRVSNLDKRLGNADQNLTEDIAKFCNALAHMHSQISKPILDVVLMSAELFMIGVARGGSAIAPTMGIGISTFVVWATASILRAIAPPFGSMVAEQAKLEGQLRFAHARVISNAEEICFYGGNEAEKSTLEQAYTALVKQMNNIYKAKITYNAMEDFLMKYMWSVTGMVLVVIPSFFKQATTNRDDMDISTRTRLYITAKKLLVSGSEAVERVILAFKELTELSGYASRVCDTIKVFQDVREGRYQRGAANSILNQRGEVIEDNTIQFSNVPIVSPTGDVLVKSLSFHIRPGQHLLITGPNGCGKSSLFRILGGLWPVHGGTLHRPPRGQIFYVPQRPYLCSGSLRDQLTYPDSLAQIRAKNITDLHLESILAKVHLTYLLEREGGFDTVKDWSEILSGGEKQRIGMARLFYHHPQYAILDECTSAVSMDVEGKIYSAVKEEGMTLLSVSHRPSLWQYHDWILQFDGEGGWRFNELNASTMVSLKEEKTRLEAQLSGIPKMEKRLRELCTLLGDTSVILTGEEKPIEGNTP